MIRFQHGGVDGTGLHFGNSDGISTLARQIPKTIEIDGLKCFRSRVGGRGVAAQCGDGEWEIEAQSIITLYGWSSTSLAPGDRVVVGVDPPRERGRSWHLAGRCRKSDGTTLRIPWERERFERRFVTRRSPGAENMGEVGSAPICGQVEGIEPPWSWRRCWRHFRSSGLTTKPPAASRPTCMVSSRTAPSPRPSTSISTGFTPKGS